MEQVINQTYGSAQLRGVKRGDAFVGQVFTDTGKSVQISADSAPELLEKLKSEAARMSGAYVGFDGARRRFLEFLPDGFLDSRYIEQERVYKLARKSSLETAAPLSARPFSALQASGAAKAFSINLLHSTEQIRAKEALSSPQGHAILEALAEFTDAPSQPTLHTLAALLKPFEAARWTVITLLPFFWKPDRHMFLKPEVTCEFAAAVGHPFHLEYTAELDLGVYEALLDLAYKTEQETSGMNPSDRIDVQSFIWVVGRYTLDDAGKGPELQADT